MKQKVVLVTGANRGIGFETANKFLNEGHIVIFSARREEAGIAAMNKLTGNKENIVF